MLGKKAKTLEQILLEQEFLTHKQLRDSEKTARRTRKKLTEVLVEQKLLTSETLSTILSFLHGVPLVNLKMHEVQSEALALIPKEMARKNNILPLAIEDGDILIIAMDDPSDIPLIDALSALCRKRIRPVISLHSSINTAIDKYYK
ncbi:MAG: hypothetical protein Q7R84_01250 [bacterium]|nr:hypothetical protein [bacterium]